MAKTTLDLIEAAKAMPEGEEKNILVVKLANLMKRHFLTWNRNTVEDSVIAGELKAKSGGALILLKALSWKARRTFCAACGRRATPWHVRTRRRKSAAERVWSPQTGVDNPSRKRTKA